MTKFFYEWEDTTDPHATGIPDLGRYPHCRATTKAQVRREWREYCEMCEYCEMFTDLRPNPKIRVWRISYEKVKL